MNGSRLQAIPVNYTSCLSFIYLHMTLQFFNWHTHTYETPHMLLSTNILWLTIWTEPTIYRRTWYSVYLLSIYTRTVTTASYYYYLPCHVKLFHVFLGLFTTPASRWIKMSEFKEWSCCTSRKRCGTCDLLADDNLWYFFYNSLFHINREWGWKYIIMVEKGLLK